RPPPRRRRSPVLPGGRAGRGHRPRAGGSRRGEGVALSALRLQGPARGVVPRAPNRGCPREHRGVPRRHAVVTTRAEVFRLGGGVGGITGIPPVPVAAYGERAHRCGAPCAPCRSRSATVVRRALPR